MSSPKTVKFSFVLHVGEGTSPSPWPNSHVIVTDPPPPPPKEKSCMNPHYVHALSKNLSCLEEGPLMCTQITWTVSQVTYIWSPQVLTQNNGLS